MLIFFYGEDSYRSYQKIKQIKNKARVADPSGMNISVFDFENLDFYNIKKNIESSPFLAKKRLIIICDLLAKGKKEVKEKLVTYLKKNEIPETSYVVFWERGWPNEKQALFKFLKNKGKSEIFEALEGMALNRWIEKEVLGFGGQIDKNATNLLASYVGGNLWRMRKEIEKLVLYKDDKNKIITNSDVKNLVKAALDENIFNFADAISGKNKKLALKLLRDQLALGKEEIYLLAMIVYQFRNMLLVCDAVEKGINRFEIAKKLKIHPYVVQKTMRSAGKYSAQRLKKIYRELLVADERLKSYGPRGGTTLDMLICKVCQ